MPNDIKGTHMERWWELPQYYGQLPWPQNRQWARRN
jgi:hypothetical protein